MPPAGKVELALVAYSYPAGPYEHLIKAFQSTSDGSRTSSFSQSFGASGDQSRAVEAGHPADSSFSLEPDMTRLVNDGLVAADWNKTPTKGMTTDSVVVFVVRKGNPKTSRPGTT